MLLILTPYILVPFIITFLFRQFNLESKKLTYLITGLLMFFYPILFFWIKDLIDPPTSGFRCGNPQMAFIFLNIIFLMPLSLLFQLAFNKSYL
ncbi:hypothetical protein SAMN05444397_108266 [Flavobacterium aquidurense]|uniref:Uncharacterized protein n=1 Tax=Flavobacterium frigidimaris TaxID=262320 RepID=A0ABX4BVB8_FLAFR|nr:hypothetical protein B0A65_02870 [Flavobacterium frigidimaris]SDZ54375.1 hypothetical protein SAMN05444397_108266 [Flavobacterium aquidurense]